MAGLPSGARICRSLAGRGNSRAGHPRAGGRKLAALLARGKRRDLFDSRQIFRLDTLDPRTLRLAFVVYGAMNRRDWRTVSADDVGFDPAELARQLVPTLRADASGTPTQTTEYGEGLVRECREGLSRVLPFTENEREFLDRLLDQRTIHPALLTATRPSAAHPMQPLLQWKASTSAATLGKSLGQDVPLRPR